MPQFNNSAIYLDKETVAEQLRTTRQAKDWKLSAVAKELKISVHYLQALEGNRYEDLPAGVYGLNFLRTYADFLDLDYEKLRSKFLEEKEVYRSGKQNKLFARQIVSGRYFWAVPRMIKGGLVALATLGCLFYLAWLLRGIFLPPHLTVYSPKPDLVTLDSVILVNGQTDPETEVLINNAQTMVDAKGAFAQEINLKEGINTITIVAQRNTSKQTKIVREVLLNVQ
ncbi:MAG: putative membrane protein [Candidatus Falkowbacteria bacterium GW2011_GWA2_39_24]|uniref:Putative membrane protein n=1 Tax=Candidatus Falkowbacteria bacterium GW2011_GWA2_39_24 TaxID=1618634 RepID=A0A0G0NFQ6_9BACT|nr:MAG: putative membrane protein [Candidatus Falkowbacteria bacterium GW2011_GWA2_39_24]